MTRATDHLELPVEIPASPGERYHIVVAPGALASLGASMHAADIEPTGAGVITNPTVGAHYADTVTRSLRAVGIPAFVRTMPDGEEYKTVDTLKSLVEKILDGGLDRGGCVVALGGGVVGDTAGLAAALFMRGIPVVQVPTSLLAMVDASVGGKTAVDLPQGKNLLGAFHQPSLVVIDPDVLQTLEPVEFRCGMAEVVKHAIIAGGDLHDALERQMPTPESGIDPEVLAQAIAVKIDIVEEDPYENGRRAVLNLGHTFGHAFEQLSSYRIRHGEAVAVGLVAAADLGVRLGRAEASLADHVSGLVEAAGLPTQVSGRFDVEDVIGAMSTDKKKRAGRLRFVVPSAVGEVELVEDVPVEDVRAAVRRVLE